MLKQLFFVIQLFSFTYPAFSQDSMWVRLKPEYNKAGGLHRFLFGENYRKEWSDSTLLPVIDLAGIEGGLKPVKLGGGHQTVSLRMVSAEGNEWVLRNIEKDASVLLPVELRNTFAREVIDDAMSAQHPFSPLVVAEIADAVNVPHATPIIGVVRKDSLLGQFSSYFAGRVCLLEEREPFGESENSARMFRDLDNDNDNSIDAENFLRARLLDLLIADWDRHPDQWRWVDTRKGKTKYYLGIPRDRDQAFYVNQGIFPGLASRPWFAPMLQGFEAEIKHPRYSLKEGSFLHSRPAMHMDRETWMRITHEFTDKITDSVLAKALRKLPSTAWNLRQNELFNTLRTRLNNIPAAMEQFYDFVNRVADLQLSNKHEFISIINTQDGDLKVNVEKISKKDLRVPFFSATYSPSVTKEIRIYTGKGNDTVFIDNKNSPVQVRIIGGEGNKKFHLKQSARKVKVYNNRETGNYQDDAGKLKLRLSDDSLHTAYVPANRYNIFKPLVAAGFNRDDGFLLGLGFQYTKQGFRKVPYASVNKLVLYHSFATSAFRLRYSGEWMDVIDKTDIVATADVFAPQNTMNFFGRGNESVFDKNSNNITFYRTRFSLYTLNAGLRWVSRSGWNFSVGPSFQHYQFDSSDNKGRILNTFKNINSYDSSFVGESKTHAGALLGLGKNKKNNQVIPSAGYFVNVRIQAYGGLNDYSRSFAQMIPEFSFYKSLNSKKSLIVAGRTGAGISVGKTTFYQSVFIGGNDNLLGYRQYRFAGEHMLYNNLELRARLANFTGYIIPGEFGLLGFYDVGRVWIENEESSSWHQGTGGGLYFAPAKLAVVSVMAGYSREGWYPYIRLGFRY